MPADRVASAACLLAQLGECFGEDCLALGVVAALAYVREVGLVRLVARRRGRVLLVLARRPAAAWAVPLVGDGRVGRETRSGFMTIRAPERDPDTRRRFTAFVLAHRTRTDPAPPNGVATCHVCSL